MTTPTDNDDYRTRDKSLHGLLVVLGITCTIAAVVIGFAYAASGGAIFGINTTLPPSQNKPGDSTPSLTSIQEQQTQEVVTGQQQQEIDQKEADPVASLVESENELVVVEKPWNTDTRIVEVLQSSDQSLQYVNMSTPTPQDDGNGNKDTSTASTSDNNSQVRDKNKPRDNNTDADEKSSNNSAPSSSPQPANSIQKELTKEEKKVLKEKEEQEKKLQKLLAKALDSLCSSAIDGIVNDNIEVAGTCQIDATVKGNIKLDAPDDSIKFVSGSLDGNIEAKDSDEVNVASGISIDGNVKSENTADTNIGAAVVSGNIEVKDGNLKIMSRAEIYGNVKHEGSGSCLISAGAIVHGQIEGCATS